MTSLDVKTNVSSRVVGNVTGEIVELVYSLTSRGIT